MKATRSITATNLRKSLFKTIESALTGETITIETRKGKAWLVSEEFIERLAASGKPKALSPKISGEITGNLEKADEELRKHLRLPA